MFPAQLCSPPPGSPHQHVICSWCGVERVVLPDAGELAWLASGNQGRSELRDLLCGESRWSLLREAGGKRSMGIALIVALGIFLVAAAYGLDLLPSLLIFLGPVLFLAVAVAFIAAGVTNRHQRSKRR
jgi:hypothetical protein